MSTRPVPGRGAAALRAPARACAAVLGTAALAAALLVAVTAAPAAAHVEVLGRPAQAGATDALVSFHASGESPTAGVAAITVQLPAGIAPGDVSWVSGPPGWQFQRTADGYLAAGPPLAKGVPGRYEVKIARLPDRPSLVFKTVVRYADGGQDAWTDDTGPGAGQSDHPAPVLALAGATRTGAGSGDGPGTGRWPLVLGAAAGVGVLAAVRLAVHRRGRREAEAPAAPAP